MVSFSDKDALRARLTGNLQPISPGIESLDFSPDLHVERIGDIDLDTVASWGVKHVLIDYDGVFVDGSVRGPIDEEALQFARTAAQDARFESVDLATDNGTSGPPRLAPLISDKARVFTPFDDSRYTHYKTGPNGVPTLYRRILFQLGDEAADHPETVVMIGDSPYHDVLQAQKAGLRTVLVDSIIARKLSHSMEEPETVEETERQALLDHLRSEYEVDDNGRISFNRAMEGEYNVLGQYAAPYIDGFEGKPKLAEGLDIVGNPNDWYTLRISPGGLLEFNDRLTAYKEEQKAKLLGEISTQ